MNLSFRAKKSILILFLITFWVAYSGTSIFLFYRDVQRTYDLELETKLNRLRYQADLANQALVLEQYEWLKLNLEQAIELYQIDFAHLKIPGQKDFLVKSIQDVTLSADTPFMTEPMVYENLLFQKIGSAESGVELVLGTIHDRGLFTKAYFEVYAGKIAFDIFIVTCIAWLLIFWVMKDILNLSKVLSSTGRRVGLLGRGLSKESDVLIRATQSYDQLSKDLASQVQVFANSIGSAIVTELRRGTPVPSSFSCVVVRVDLNGFTEKSLSSNLEEMISVMNIYFETSRKIIERHQGLIYEYVGDEIIFIFKNKDKAAGLRIALACLRDLFEEMSDLSGIEISLKSSVAFGVLNFVKLHGSYSFSGIPLISTARLIAQATKRSRFSVVLESADLEKGLGWISKQDQWDLKLKGFSEVTSITEILEFSVPQARVPQLHRSTLSLVQFFEELQIWVDRQDWDEFFVRLSSLQILGLEAAEEKVEAAYLKILSSVVQISREAAVPMKVLSSLVSLSKNMVRRSEYLRVRPWLEALKAKADPRLKANILLTQSYFDLNTPVSEELKSPNNRLLADALLVLGRRSLDERVVSEIYGMIKNPNKVFRSSAYFITAELLKYYKEKDPIFYQSSGVVADLKKLLRESLKDSEYDFRKHARHFEAATGEALV